MLLARRFYQQTRLLDRTLRKRSLSTLVTASLIITGVPLGLYTYKCLMLVAFQNSLIYMGYLPPGSRHNYDYQRYIPPPLTVQEKTIVTDDKKRLHGFIVTKKQQQQQQQDIDITLTKGNVNQRKKVMIYFQGNAGNMLDRFGLFHIILQAVPEVTIVAICYRQYGNSNGYASEKGLQKDAMAILQSVISMYGKDTALYLYGHSLGGAVALDLMGRLPANTNKNGDGLITTDMIDGVMIENTFTSIYSMVCTLYSKYTPYPYIAKWCLWNHWRSDLTLRKLPSSTTRLLFLSSERDEIVPQQHMNTLYSIARSSHIHQASMIKFKRSLHMDIYSTETRLFQQSLRQFIT